MAKTFAVTGAYGYTGKYVAKRLLGLGHKVITLTSNPDRPNPFGERVKTHPFNFDQPEKLAETLEQVDVLINTYWVRFNHRGHTYDKAVANTKTLFQAAKEAGVERVVHVSIANPTLDSPLPYYSGKAELEAALKASGLSYAILRPTVIFGQEDILINNIAWFLRRLPAFGVPGDGQYRLQPIYVDDMAKLAVDVSMQKENMVVNAIGPETYTFNELVALLKKATGSRSLVLHLPPTLAYWATSLVGLLVGDVVLTKEEVIGLMDDLLATDSPPAGETRLSQWVQAHAGTLGKRYANEVKRHFHSTRQALEELS